MSLVLSWKSELDWPNGAAGLRIGKLMWGTSARQNQRASLQLGVHRNLFDMSKDSIVPGFRHGEVDTLEKDGIIDTAQIAAPQASSQKH